MARANLGKAAREAAAKAGFALPNGKYPIRSRRELRAAIKLRHHSTEPYVKVRGHILKRAAALGIKVSAAQVASAGPGMTVFACYEKACAPPPAGTGGSSKAARKAQAYVAQHKVVGRAHPDGLEGVDLSKRRKQRELEAKHPFEEGVWGEISRTLNQDVPGASLEVRIPMSALHGILTEGYKSQRTLGTSKGGRLDPEFRDRLEAKTFGWDVSESAKHNIAYGYLRNPQASMYTLNQVNPDAYGNVSLVMKPHVRSDTTITMGDSLKLRDAPAPIRLSEAGNYTSKDVFYAHPQPHLAPTWPGYIEAQIHRTIRPSDIESVIIRDTDASDIDSLKRQYPNVQFQIRDTKQYPYWSTIVAACYDAACAPPPVGRGGSSKSGSFKRHPIITAAEARGDSKPVTRAEFQRLASIGQSKLDAMSTNASPITGLDNKWSQIKADSYAEARKEWGGATIDAHTGKAVAQGASRYALTVKEKGGETVSISEKASKAEFDAAMDMAKERFRHILEREGHHLGVFHDDDLGRIDIDPVLVVDKLEDVHTIGAATRAIGGAYNFSDGNGYWPPHVAEEG